MIMPAAAEVGSNEPDPINVFTSAIDVATALTTSAEIVVSLSAAWTALVRTVVTMSLEDRFMVPVAVATAATCSATALAIDVAVTSLVDVSEAIIVAAV